MGQSLKNPILNGTATSVEIPFGSTATRPTSPISGMLRYNTSLNQIEFYNGSNWQSIQGGIGGSAAITRDSFTLDGSTLAYGPLTSVPASGNNVLVFIEGVFQNASQYSISNTTITLSTILMGDAGKTLTVLHGFDTV
jgi:hypothetical protein